MKFDLSVSKNYYKEPSDKTLAEISKLSYKNDRELKQVDGLKYHNFFENEKTGFYADVYYNDNYVVFVFRGTEQFSFKDLNTDRVMGHKKEVPAQFYDALKLYDKIQESQDFQDKTPICTGHSLGGSMADFVASRRGDKAVAFSPYAIGDIVKKPIEGTDITNYGNPNDPVFMENFKNHIGKVKYVFNHKNFSEEYKYNPNDNFKRKLELAFKFFHTIEQMGDINMATDDITGQKFLNKIKERFPSDTLDESLKKIYNGVYNYIDIKNNNNTFNGDSNCSGYVNVSSYTRDGYDVKGYTRVCPKHRP